MSAARVRLRRGLEISAGIGFGYFVLSETLPDFLGRYPDIDVSLYLTVVRWIWSRRESTLPYAWDAWRIQTRHYRTRDDATLPMRGTVLFAPPGHAAIHCGTEGTRDN